MDPIMPQRRSNFGLQFIILGIFLVITLSRIYVDWQWFSSLGYLGAYKTMLFSKLGVGIAAGAFIFLALAINILIADRIVKLSQKKTWLSFALGISVLSGYFASSFWFSVPRFLNSNTFGFVDPLFQKDIAFYVLDMPFYYLIVAILFAAGLLSLGISFAAYLLTQKPKKAAKPQPQVIPVDDEAQTQVQSYKIVFSQKSKAHLFAIAGVLLAALAVFFYLKRFSLLYSHRGAVYGAGYTDVHIALPLYTLLFFLCLISAALSLSYFRHVNTKLVLGSIALVFGLLFSGMLVSGVVQMLYVEPNEFNLEQPYITQNIKHTLFAYGLTDVEVRDFPVTYDLSASDIAEHKAMIDNVRLWDWRPLLTTYRQLQLFRTYYDFVDVDIDRYTLDGKMTQLMTSPRELDPAQLDSKAKTWVNERLVYTHGFGVVTSPVNEISKEGLPDLYVQDIPPKTSFDELLITEPRIYFGEKTQGFIITTTKSNEFDYPLGNENVFATYNGSDGIAMGGIFKKAIFSINLGSLNLMVSSALTDSSKVVMRRNIMERVRTLAPYLDYDSDPYIVISEGKLYWIIDAYTTSKRFPYSESSYGFNYIRNSVKVVVDAYEGKTTFYVMDQKDPLIRNYASIFPSLYKGFDEMPVDIKKHIRYPEDLFRIQNEMYGVYHMKDAQVFYNKEDVWRMPMEIYDRDQVEMDPYYIILKLPNEEKEGFYLIRPFIPRGKDNMVAWMAASSNPDDYGKIEVFRLSKQELIYGPMQIEARINQDTDIAQLFTLWSQQGSQVIRGNMIVIPIKDSFLYIEPVYLKASAGGALPQLKRVVVAYEDK
ncbi:MAG TPA: UPF0182 family protein, partial [Candidatus Nanoarchaeia archaeon]|nr:UPF0182 family protein [Candidatus Nanoarchaeia archaeon]